MRKIDFDLKKRKYKKNNINSSYTIQKYTNTKIQKYKNTKIQKYKNTKIQKYKPPKKITMELLEQDMYNYINKTKTLSFADLIKEKADLVDVSNLDIVSDCVYNLQPVEYEYENLIAGLASFNNFITLFQSTKCIKLQIQEMMISYFYKPRYYNYDPVRIIGGLQLQKCDMKQNIMNIDQHISFDRKQIICSISTCLIADINECLIVIVCDHHDIEPFIKILEEKQKKLDFELVVYPKNKRKMSCKKKVVLIPRESTSAKRWIFHNVNIKRINMAFFYGNSKVLMEMKNDRVAVVDVVYTTYNNHTMMNNNEYINIDMCDKKCFKFYVAMISTPVYIHAIVYKYATELINTQLVINQYNISGKLNINRLLCEQNLASVSFDEFIYEIMDKSHEIKAILGSDETRQTKIDTLIATSSNAALLRLKNSLGNTQNNCKICCLEHDNVGVVFGCCQNVICTKCLHTLQSISNNSKCPFCCMPPKMITSLGECKYEKTYDIILNSITKALEQEMDVLVIDRLSTQRFKTMYDVLFSPFILEAYIFHMEERFYPGRKTPGNNNLYITSGFSNVIDCLHDVGEIIIIGPHNMSIDILFLKFIKLILSFKSRKKIGVTLIT